MFILVTISSINPVNQAELYYRLTQETGFKTLSNTQKGNRKINVNLHVPKQEESQDKESEKLRSSYSPEVHIWEYETQGNTNQIISSSITRITPTENLIIDYAGTWEKNGIKNMLLWLRVEVSPGGRLIKIQQHVFDTNWKDIAGSEHAEDFARRTQTHIEALFEAISNF